MPDPAHVQLDGARSVIVSRAFAAPRGVVWAAFTDPDVLGKWLLGPPGWEMLVCDVSLSIGGGYRWRWRNDASGEEFGFTGTYSDVQVGTRLVDSQRFDQGTHAIPMGEATQNTVEFSDDGAGTLVVTTILYPDAATRDLVMGQGMAAGMEMSYVRLDQVLANSADFTAA